MFGEQQVMTGSSVRFTQRRAGAHVGKNWDQLLWRFPRAGPREVSEQRSDVISVLRDGSTGGWLEGERIAERRWLGQVAKNKLLSQDSGRGNGEEEIS